jgi:curved DNA-binding protein
MKYKDYYAILGVPRTASADDVKKAYRKLAKQYHPDVSKEKNAEERFKEINEAHQTLSDPEKKAAYDQLGQYQPGEEIRPPPGWGREFRFEQGDFDGFMDLSDLFEHLGAAGFGRSAGRGRAGAGGRGFAMRGQDYEVTAHLTLEEVFRGAELNLDLSAPEMSPDGEVRRVPKTIHVRVPKGATDGQRLRVPGKGGPGARGGPPGDLYLNIVLRPHPLYRVQEHDLYLDLPVTPWEAVLGAGVEVPTLDGRVKLSIRPGSHAGQKLRLAGKGLPKPKGGAGDLYCVLQVVMPTVVSDREKQLYEELGRLATFNPRGHLA